MNSDMGFETLDLKSCEFEVLRLTVRPVCTLRIRKLRASATEVPGASPMDLGIPPLKIKSLLESIPLKFRF